MSTAENTAVLVRWHDSLIYRVILLCVVLVVCLLGSVYVIMRYSFHEVIQEMETRTQEIADRIVVEYENNPAHELGTLEREYRDRGVGIRVEQLQGAAVPTHVMLERTQEGSIAKVARLTILLGEGQQLLTVRVPLDPPTEILRAFRNKYLALLTVAFLVTLGLMIYFIARTLRPLGELSQTCAKISQGDLRDVAVRKNSGEILALEQTFNRMVASLRDKEVVETRLRRAQRLSALGTLAAGVAHDVRNPLNAIKLLSSHAIDTLEGGADGTAAVKQLQTIRNEVDRLEDIVSGFLSLAKERELRPEPCRIDSLLEECLRLIAQDAAARDIRLLSELRAGDTTLSLDPKQGVRAILNVLLNALDACPRGGRVRLFSRATDTTCEIEIRDDGAGLTKETAERAFDPYFTTKPTGTGLGLSITRGIIEEHGGSIELSGEEGQGCQALIRLPLKERNV